MEPIIILTTGRSGSSLVANIFKEHGCFWGDGRQPNRYNPKGYFENREINQLAFLYMGRDWLKGELPQDDSDFKTYIEAIIERQGYKGGPWFIKIGALYNKMFYQFNPTFIHVIRDREAILDSYERCKFLHRFTRKEREQIVDSQLEIMDRLPGYRVNTDVMVKGNYYDIQQAIEGSGLKYDSDKVLRCIDPRLFHEVS